MRHFIDAPQGIHRSPAQRGGMRREQQLRWTRLASRGMVALSALGAAGASIAIAVGATPQPAATQNEDAQPGRTLQDSESGWARDRNQWPAPDPGVAPGGSSAPQGMSGGS